MDESKYALWVTPAELDRIAQALASDLGDDDADFELVANVAMMQLHIHRGE
jgi:hypothetical protein